MAKNESRDVVYWVKRFDEDKKKMDGDIKLSLIKALLLNITPLTPQEVELFLASKDRLSNPDSLMQYAVIERTVARVFSSGCQHERWKMRESYLSGLRSALTNFYNPRELNEIQALILSDADATAITASLAFDHWGYRRIRNAYLPEITTLIEINPETGRGVDATPNLFREGQRDSVSRIEKLLGLEES